MTKPTVTPRDYWGTPDYIIKEIEALTKYKIRVDLCATADNAKAPIYVTEEDDLLSFGPDDWLDLRRKGDGPRGPFPFNDWAAFMNPPYSRGNLPVFAKKAIEASAYFPVFMLIPFVPCDKWWGEVLDQSTAYEGVLLPRRRVNFVPPEGVKPSSQPSQHCIVVLDNRKPSGAIVSVPYMLRLEEVYD